jgi:shikimate dehydrogenase
MNTPSASTRVFALIGSPVRQSLSPSMHNTLFERLKIDAIYVALEVDPAKAEAVADAVRVLQLGGVNLTVPFKERVLPFLDELTQDAAAAGAVNVVVNQGGKLVGHNTDGAGFLRALQEELEADVVGQRVGILGAGGTGRAVAAACAGAGATQITLYNRTLSRAEQAVGIFQKIFPKASFEARELLPYAFMQHDRVVNCTAPAASALIAKLPVACLKPGAIWTDANYYIVDPPNFAACARGGIRLQRGIGMLMHQGALSFELFTGVPVGIAQVRGVLDVGSW